MASIDRFADGQFCYVIEHVIAKQTHLVEAPWRTYAELAACAILFCSGAYVQFNLTAKKFHHQKKEVESSEETERLLINTTWA